MPSTSKTEYTGGGGSDTASRDERPRGLRARFRNRRVRTALAEEGSDQRLRSNSLDLSSYGGSEMTVPDQDTDAGDGLMLEEFGEFGEEVVEDDVHKQKDADNKKGYNEYTGKRRESIASAPEGTEVREHEGTQSDLSGTGSDVSESYSGSETGASSGGEYSSNAEMNEFDADAELNAVYLKRNADFHTLFRNIPINELLIDDYGCALQRDILVQGRLYLTENFVCFYSNIFGWVTNLVIAIDEIVSIDKKMTALIIPNAIQVSTLHTKYFLGSFIYRDSAYNQLIDLWGKSRSERNAGLPEIGHAIQGDGAGDVSRNRDDVLAGYHSLSENEVGKDSGEDDGYDDDDDRSISASIKPRGHNSRPSAEANSRSSDSSGNDSDTESEAEGGGSDSGGAKNSMNHTVESMPSTKPGSVFAGHNSETNASAAASKASMRSLAVQIPAALSASSSQAAMSSATERGAAMSGHTTADGATRVASSQTITGVQQTNGEATAARPRSLLTRVPDTPEDDQSLKASKEALPGEDAQHEQTVELHKPTTCPCLSDGSGHFSTTALDTVFPLSLPLLFRIVFSASIPRDVEDKYIPRSRISREELDKLCTDRIKQAGNMEVKTEGWIPVPDAPEREMCTYLYERPLGFSIGPKSTAVEDIYTIKYKEFDRAVVVDQIVRTPNVPSGTSFFVKIRHCLSWTAGPSNEPAGGWTRVVTTFEIEWVKSSWIKNAIEKGSADSNKHAGEHLEKYVREWIAAHPDLEVKASTAAAITGADRKSAGEKKRRRRQRRAGGSKRREGSPHGLRIEELLGSSSIDHTPAKNKAERRRSSRLGAVIGAGDGAVGQSQNGIDRLVGEGEDAEAAEWAKAARESWVGWAGYYTVYPINRAYAVAVGNTVPPSMSLRWPATVGVLVLVLLLTNLWRLPGMGAERSLEPARASEGLVRVQGMKEMQMSIDELTGHLKEVSERLERLIEAHDANRKLNAS